LIAKPKIPPQRHSSWWLHVFFILLNTGMFLCWLAVMQSPALQASILRGLQRVLN
jgi:hypothetical protein